MMYVRMLEKFQHMTNRTVTMET